MAQSARYNRLYSIHTSKDFPCCSPSQQELEEWFLDSFETRVAFTKCERLWFEGLDITGQDLLSCRILSGYLDTELSRN